MKADTRNITLALPRDLIKEAKIIAARRESSVSALLAEDPLAKLVRDDQSFTRARDHHLKTLRSGFDLGTNGQPTWKRDDLHGR